MKKEKINLKDFFSSEVEELTDEQILQVKGGDEPFHNPGDEPFTSPDCKTCQTGCSPGGQACVSCQPGQKKN